MLNKKRIYHFNHCHYIKLRGVGGRALFFDDEDRVRFCLFLQTSVETGVFNVHAFCLMPRHIHLVIEPKTRSQQEGIKCLLSRYAHYYRQKYPNEMSLFEEPYQSSLILDEACLVRLVRFIHLEPVRGGITCTPERYIWSSHCAYLGLHPLAWLTEERVLSYFNLHLPSAVYTFVDYIRDWMEAQEDLLAIKRGDLPRSFSREQHSKNETRSFT